MLSKILDVWQISTGEPWQKYEVQQQSEIRISKRWWKIIISTFYLLFNNYIIKYIRIKN